MEARNGTGSRRSVVAHIAGRDVQDALGLIVAI